MLLSYRANAFLWLVGSCACSSAAPPIGEVGWLDRDGGHAPVIVLKEAGAPSSEPSASESADSGPPLCVNASRSNDPGATAEPGEIEVGAIRDAVAIGSSPDRDHTCVVHRTGQVSCWGKNNLGQLGNGTYDNSTKAVRVHAVTTAVDVVAFMQNSCALEAGGSVACWGDGGEYATGFGDGLSLYPTAGTVCNVERVEAISSAGLATCALLQGGQVMCWGYSEGGSPREMVNDAVSIGTTTSSTCVALQSGEVSCWGLGSLGFIGGEPGATATLPGLSAVKKLGANGLCGLQHDATVACWGDLGGNNGQVQSVPGLDAVDVLADAGSCAIHHGGRVACFELPQLGEQITAAQDVPGLTDAIDVSGNCAVRITGEVQCWE